MLRENMLCTWLKCLHSLWQILPTPFLKLKNNNTKETRKVALSKRWTVSHLRWDMLSFEQSPFSSLVHNLDARHTTITSRPSTNTLVHPHNVCTNIYQQTTSLCRSQTPLSKLHLQTPTSQLLHVEWSRIKSLFNEFLFRARWRLFVQYSKENLWEESA